MYTDDVQKLIKLLDHDIISRAIVEKYHARL